MAIVRTALDVEQMDGCAGATCYRVRNSIGVAWQSRGRRPNRSRGQVAHREVFRAATRAWADLDEAERQEWRVWADAFGDPGEDDPLPAIDGRGRFIGQAIMRIMAGLDPLRLPSEVGIGEPQPAFIACFPIEGTETATVQMLEPYPSVTTPPALASVLVSEPGRGSDKSNRHRMVHAQTVGLTKGGPGAGSPPVVVATPEPVRRGQSLWIGTRVVTGAGNVGRRRDQQIEMPTADRVRAFRIRSWLPELNPQQWKLEGGELVLQAFVGTGDQFEQRFNLSAPDNATVADLFDTINGSSIFLAVDPNPSSSGRLSTDLVESPLRRVNVTQQPSLLSLPEV